MPVILVIVTLPWCWYYLGYGYAIFLAITVALAIAIAISWRLSLAVLILSVLTMVGLELNLSHILPRSLQHQTTELTVCVSQKMTQYPDFYSANARVVAQPGNTKLRNVRLTVSAGKIDQALMPGSCISGDFRLRQPTGFLTPGGFDSDRYFFSKHIDAKATLISLNEVFQAPSFVQRLYADRLMLFADSLYSDVWAALVLGWSGSLDTQVKQLFSSNQLMHLFVISGMHIGFISFFVLNVTKLMSRPLSAYLPLSRAWLYSLTLGVIILYVSLLGWPVPATRALIMFGVPLFMYMLAVKVNWLSALMAATVIISVLQPEAWLSLGAWLSFSSVAVILLLLRWNLLRFNNSLVKLIIFQCAMSLTVIPWAFMAGFPINPLAAALNLLVTPLIGFMLLPLAFLLWFYPQEWSASLFEWLVSWLFRLLEITSAYAFQTPWVGFSTVALCVAVLVALFWWADGSERLLMTLFVTVAGLLAVSFQPETKHYPEITFFDVGHGSAVLIEDKFGRWLVDTGGGYGSDSSFYERDLDRQIGRLNYLIVTHADSDHSMAVEYILKQEEAVQAWSGQPNEFRSVEGQSNIRDCHQSTSLSPYLRFIPVPAALRNSDNNYSCILLYQTEFGRLLLTGDADKTVEYYLLQHFSELFPFDVVLLGHHGSNSSSSSDWLAANSGAIYVVSTGDRARPAWPSPRIKGWFAESGQKLFSTAEKGTLRVTFKPQAISINSWDTAYRNRLIN